MLLKNLSNSNASKVWARGGEKTGIMCDTESALPSVYLKKVLMIKRPVRWVALESIIIGHALDALQLLD